MSDPKEITEEVGMILMSKKTWDKVKILFPPSVKKIFPTVGFMNDIPIRVSDLCPDDKIIPVPKRVTDIFTEKSFAKPIFKSQMRFESFI